MASNDTDMGRASFGCVVAGGHPPCMKPLVDAVAAWPKGVDGAARYIGITTKTLLSWMSGTTQPTLRNHLLGRRGIMRWPRIERRLVEMTGRRMEELFPAFRRLPACCVIPPYPDVDGTIEFRMRWVSNLLDRFEDESLPDPLAEVEKEERQAAIRKVIDMALPKSHLSRKAFFLWTGLDGSPLTFDKVARVMGVSGDRARTLALTALKKLQHPLYSKHLEHMLAR